MRKLLDPIPTSTHKTTLPATVQPLCADQVLAHDSSIHTASAHGNTVTARTVTPFALAHRRLAHSARTVPFRLVRSQPMPACIRLPDTGSSVPFHACQSPGSRTLHASDGRAPHGKTMPATTGKPCQSMPIQHCGSQASGALRRAPHVSMHSHMRSSRHGALWRNSVLQPPAASPRPTCSSYACEAFRLNRKVLPVRPRPTRMSRSTNEVILWIRMGAHVSTLTGCGTTCLLDGTRCVPAAQRRSEPWLCCLLLVACVMWQSAWTSSTPLRNSPVCPGASLPWPCGAARRQRELHAGGRPGGTCPGTRRLSAL